MGQPSHSKTFDETELGTDIDTDGGRHEIYVQASSFADDGSGRIHYYTWWFTPVMGTGPEDARIQPERFLHKTATEACSPATVTDDHEGETIITHIGWMSDPEEITMADVPDTVIETLMDWFGHETVERSVKHAGGELPTHIYECLNCETVVETTPRRTCVECNSSETVRHHSRETIGENTEILQYLVDAEVSTSLDIPDEE